MIVPSPILTIKRDPDASTTLSHGDSLKLTCTILLNPAVDPGNDVTISGNLSGSGGASNTLVMESKRMYSIMLTLSSLNSTLSDTYTCITVISPSKATIVIPELATYILNITVGKSCT